jgi:hypothetical protein
LIQTATRSFTPSPTPDATYTPTPTLTWTPVYSTTPTPILSTTPSETNTPTGTLTASVTPTTITVTPPSPTIEPTSTPTAQQCILPESVTGELPSDDTYLYHVKPDSNYGGESTINIRPEYNGEMHALLRFDLSGIPEGATITSATLYLNGLDENNGHDNSVYLLTTAWDEESATWNYPWSVPGGDFDDQVLLASFEMGQYGCAIPIDLTDLVTGWTNGTYENYGILISASGPRSIAHYVSKEDPVNLDQRPRLAITYIP